ncbi:MAG: hypothetical protein J6S96_02520 [Muribaculaceae bacterium]|nr:hypothetical protein [Muribaculaceae bacterium]
MKIKFLKLICLFVLFAAGTNLGIAQDEITVLKSRYPHPQQFQSISNIDFDKSQYQKVQNENGIERYIKKSVLERNKLKAANRAGAENATVTIVFNMPADEIDGWPAVEITDIRFYNQNDVYWLYPWEIVDDELVAELPQGSYQLLIQMNLNPDAPISRGCAYGIIAKENITINQDTTITIDYADAKNVIYQEKKLPNGELFSDGDYDAQTEQYINQPNVYSRIGTLNLIDQDWGSVISAMLKYYEDNYIDENGVSHDLRFRLLVSDLSDRYTILLKHAAICYDDERNNIYTVTSVKSGVSDSENLACSGIYKTISSNFQPSILGENYTEAQGLMIGLIDVNDITGARNMTRSLLDTGITYSSLNMHVCQGGDDLPSYYKTYYNVSPREYDSNEPKCIIVPWGDVSGDEAVYQVMSPDKEFTYNMMPNGKINYQPSSTFSFKESEAADCFGNNTPVNVFGFYYDGMGTKVHQPVCNYVGRMGEIRETDNYALDFSLLYNGEEICNDYQQIANGWIWQWVYGGHPDGAYDATVVNQNMMVDDMQGCNTTKVHYDTRDEDFTPPTAMMLQFRNVEDNSVTDRFEKGENGVMYLAAKDYVVNVDEQWQMGMETLPVDVIASYSPQGKDSWTVLNITEMPELFDQYTFGYIYAANLGQVKSSSENKWYDLKIVLNDVAGNWQEQVISPAFRIESGFTSIDEVGIDSNAVVVARYTVDGRRIATPQTGVNIIKYSDGSVHKVIVK